MKSARHQAILDLIEKYPIDRQEDLLEHLRRAGFDVTQATVSRDIRELRLVKTATGAGGYRYLVELYANGRRLELETNDAFWFRHDKDKGKVLQVWYNPNARCVERKSWETEFFAAVLAVIGAALLLIR